MDPASCIRRSTEAQLAAVAPVAVALTVAHRESACRAATSRLRNTFLHPTRQTDRASCTRRSMAVASEAEVVASMAVALPVVRRESACPAAANRQRSTCLHQARQTGPASCIRRSVAEAEVVASRAAVAAVRPELACRVAASLPGNMSRRRAPRMDPESCIHHSMAAVESMVVAAHQESACPEAANRPGNTSRRRALRTDPASCR
jgi:hypothetical protein